MSSPTSLAKSGRLGNGATGRTRPAHTADRRCPDEFPWWLSVLSRQRRDIWTRCRAWDEIGREMQSESGALGYETALQFLAVRDFVGCQQCLPKVVEERARGELGPFSPKGMRCCKVENEMKRKIGCPRCFAACGEKFQAVAEKAVEKRQRVTRDRKVLVERHAGDRSAVPTLPANAGRWSGSPCRRAASSVKS